MSARFALTANLAATGSSLKTIGALVNSANKRLKVYDWMVGADGTPADNALLYDLAAMDATGAGTSTAVTPKPVDLADPACDATAAENYTAEPTSLVGIPYIELPVNQRASYRWVAAPGSEIVVEATINFKLVTRVVHASYTGAAKVSKFFIE